MKHNDFALILVRFAGIIFFVSGAVYLCYAFIVYPLFLLGGDALLSGQLIIYASNALVVGPLDIFFGLILLALSRRITSFVCKYCKSE